MGTELASADRGSGAVKLAWAMVCLSFLSNMAARQYLEPPLSQAAALFTFMFAAIGVVASILALWWKRDEGLRGGVIASVASLLLNGLLVAAFLYGVITSALNR